MVSCNNVLLSSNTASVYPMTSPVTLDLCSSSRPVVVLVSSREYCSEGIRTTSVLPWGGGGGGEGGRGGGVIMSVDA